MSPFDSGDSTGEVSLADLFGGTETSATGAHQSIVDIGESWRRGGWPGIIAAPASDAQLLHADYLDQVAETDVPEAAEGFRVRSSSRGCVPRSAALWQPRSLLWSWPTTPVGLRAGSTRRRSIDIWMRSNGSWSSRIKRRGRSSISKGAPPKRRPFAFQVVNRIKGSRCLRKARGSRRRPLLDRPLGIPTTSHQHSRCWSSW